MTEMTVNQAIREATAAHKNGDTKTAARYYTSILSVQPEHPDANHNMGLILVAQKDYSNALSLFKKALKANETVDQFWLSLIGLLIELKEVKEATKYITKAQTKISDKSLLLSLQNKIDHHASGDKVPESQEKEQEMLQSIIALYRSNRFSEIVKQVSLLERKYTKSANMFNIFGAANSGLGNFKEAIRFYQKAIDLDPKFVDAYFNMGNAYKELEQFESAKEGYEEALSFNSNHVGALHNLGVIYHKQGELELALESLGKAIKVDRNFAEAFYTIGSVYYEKKSYSDALKSFKKAIEIKPKFAEAYLNMGGALFHKGELDAASECYNKAIEIKPDYTEAYDNLGSALSKKGQLDEALETFDKAIEIAPDYPIAYYKKSIILYEQEYFNAALKCLDTALDLDWNYAKAHHTKALILGKLGQLDRAIASCKRVFEIIPNHAEAFNDYGNLLFEKDQFAAALSKYDQAIEINPDYSEAHYNKGNSLFRLGELRRSINSYRKALQIKPNYHNAWNNVVYPLFANGSDLDTLKELILRKAKIKATPYLSAVSCVFDYQLGQGRIDRESVYDKALNAISNMEKSKVSNPSYKRGHKNKKQKFSSKVVALTHFGRSGTGLLHSLIDGHPEVSTLPSIYLSEYFDPSTWEKLVADGCEHIADNFISMYDVLFDASSRVPVITKAKKLISKIGIQEGMANTGLNRNDILSLDRNIFRSAFNEQMSFYKEVDQLTVFYIIHEAYNKALGDCNLKKLIFYHIHNPDTFAKLNYAHLSPNTSWVMMVREPVQCCESWIFEPFKEGDYDIVSTRIMTMLYEIDDIIYRKFDSVGIRLEDLKNEPDKTITRLCDWLGISKNECLFEMTAQGKRWWGDPSSPDFGKDGMNPFGTNNIKRKVGLVFSEKDQYIIETLFYPFRVLYCYTEANTEKFKFDLKEVQKLLEGLFDFEEKLIELFELDRSEFIKTGPYRYFRSGLDKRLNQLNKQLTYSNMIQPLTI